MIYARTDRELRLKFRDRGGAPLDITSWVIEFRWWDPSGSFSVRKTSAPGGGITIDSAHPGRATVAITRADTNVRCYTPARYEVRVTDADGRSDVWAVGSLPIEFAKT